MVRAGVDEASFATVFQEHHRRAVRLAYLLTGDPHLAEDIVSDAFAKVYVQWQKGRVRDIGPYIRQAVANQARSRLRRLGLERDRAAHRSGDDRGVVTRDQAIADRDEVWTALQRLPQRQRQVLVLRFYEDLDVAETADVLGVTTGTIKSQTSRGLDRLQQLLDHAPKAHR